MALKPCKSCKHMIDTSAKTCPSCGVAKPGVVVRKQILGVIFLTLFVAITVSVCSGNKENQSGDEASAADDVACRQDIQCWGDKHSVAAGVYCKKSVARLSKYSSRWTDGALETKFSSFRWLNQEKSTLTFIGDKIEFQNSSGAFEKHVYECDFDPENDQVLAARAKPGQL